MKKIGLIFAALLLSLSMAWASSTVVNGKVYSGADIFSPVVVGADVDVTCEGNLLSDSTDSEGYYAVLYDDGSCDPGETAEACVGSKCASAVVPEDGKVNLNIVGIDLFNVPEFSIATAALALIGATSMFVILRKRK